MDKDVKKDSCKLLKVIVAILLVMVLGLGYYFVQNEFLNKKVVNNCIDENLVVDNSNKNETEMVEYKFDTSKIVNKRTENDFKYIYRHEYMLYQDAIIPNDNLNFDDIDVTKLSNGYKFCFSGTCKELIGDFGIVFNKVVFGGGASHGDSVYFLVTKTGDLYFANNYNNKLTAEIIPNIKDVVKLYVAYTETNLEVSGAGETVLAQTKDGTIYDLFKYVKV